MPFPPLRELVPHAPPMLLLDSITAVAPDSSSVVCRAIVGSDSPFLEEGRMPALVTLEYMAQAAAVLAGLRQRSLGQTPRRGVLVGTRCLSLHQDHLSVGGELFVIARRASDKGGRAELFECTVTIGDQLVAEATILVVLETTEATT